MPDTPKKPRRRDRNQASDSSPSPEVSRGPPPPPVKFLPSEGGLMDPRYLSPGPARSGPALNPEDFPVGDESDDDDAKK
jgi:hypothetical protein